MAEHAVPRRVALITGAARRVGAVIARRLHANGWDVALHFRRSRAELDALIVELEHARPSSTLAVHADLADIGALAPLVEKTIDRFARLDALINNASAFYPTPIDRATPAQWDDLFAANARAPFFLSQAASSHLAKRSGAIVNLVDIYADTPLAAHPIYSMSKAALAAMTKALARDLAPDVRVNGVSPGAVLWPESGKSDEDQQALVERTPLKRVGTPADIASAVAWLLDAPFVTGEIMRVDGGRHLMM